MDRGLSYDKTDRKTIAGEKIHYGILYGNEKIVFIKVGADGSILNENSLIHLRIREVNYTIHTTL